MVRSFSRGLSASCSGVVVIIGVSACGSSSSSDAEVAKASNLSDGTLDVFTTAAYPPFSYLNSDGTTVVAVESDLLQEINDRLDIDVEYHVAPFDTMIPSISKGRADVAVMAMVDTPQRRKQIGFIDLHKTSWRVLTQQGNPSGLNAGGAPTAPDPLGLVAGQVLQLPGVRKTRS